MQPLRVNRKPQTDPMEAPTPHNTPPAYVVYLCRSDSKGRGFKTFRAAAQALREMWPQYCLDDYWSGGAKWVFASRGDREEFYETGDDHFAVAHLHRFKDDSPSGAAVAPRQVEVWPPPRL
jgi:hypothetical protein